MRRRGAAGLICDGAIRDVGTLAQWTDFPVFTRFVTPRGPTSAERGSLNGPAVFGGRLVRPGDLVIGDDEGLVVLTPEMVRTRIGDAEARMEREAGWEASLSAGDSMAKTFGLTASLTAKVAPPSTPQRPQRK